MSQHQHDYFIAVPPFNTNPFVHYQNIAVSLLRRPVDYYGPRFALAYPPNPPVTIGSLVHLEVYHRFEDGVLGYAIDTQIYGTLFAVASVSIRHIEFLLCNDGPGHPFCYIVAPLCDPQCVVVPPELASACQLMQPFVYCTYWPQNNVRPAAGTYTVAPPSPQYV